MMPENESTACHILSRFIMGLQRHDYGIEELSHATKLTPNGAQTQYFYDIALNSLDNFGEALPRIQEAHDLDPYEVEFLIGLATICVDSGKIDLTLGGAKPSSQLIHRICNSGNWFAVWEVSNLSLPRRGSDAVQNPHRGGALLLTRNLPQTAGGKYRPRRGETHNSGALLRTEESSQNKSGHPR